MKRTLSLALSASVVLLSSSAEAQRWNTGKHAPGEDIYKHYTGTLGGKKVALDLRYGYQGSSNYGGSRYYYLDKDERTLFFIRQPADFSHKDVLFNSNEQADDTALTSRYYDRQNGSAWNFKIEGSKLKGVWYGPGEKAEIELTEDYTNSYPLELAFFCNDVNAKSYPQTMICALPSSRSNEADASFITTQSLMFLDGPKTKARTWEDFERLNAGKFDDYRYFVPVYNDNGILVMENEFGTNIIGDHKLSYLCLDVRNHKKLEADDMLNIASMQLSGLLEDAARKKYNIPADVPLGARLLHDRIPSTKMVYPVHSGLVFCYNPGELVKDKEVVIHVPYRQLHGILTPQFSKRVGVY